MSKFDKSNKLRLKLNTRAEANMSQIATFKKAMDKNPHSALRWSSDVFEVVAENKVIQETLDTLDGGSNIEMIHIYYTNVVMTNARRIDRNSNQTVELMDAYTMTAYAKVRDILQTFL